MHKGQLQNTEPPSRSKTSVKNTAHDNIQHLTTYSSLGKLIHLLLRTSAASLEHIEESLLVGGEADDLLDKVSHKLGSLGDSL